MDANELLLLGLLDLQSMHGYRLGEFLERRLSFVSSLTRPTAYRLLERMRTRGLVERAFEREGRRPERAIYHLTGAGRSELERGLHELLPQAERVVFPGNVALLFAGRLPRSEQAELLAARRAGFQRHREELQGYLDLHSVDSPARLALEHDLAHLDAELAWLEAIVAGLLASEETTPQR